MKTEWQYQSETGMKYIGTHVFQDDKKEWHIFKLYETENTILFGGCTNCGFLQSGYMQKDECFSLDENLQELFEELEVYYNDGYRYTNGIVCNERM